MSAKCYLYIIAYSWFSYWMLSATVHCMLFMCISYMYFFSPFFVILHYHCIYYVFKYGILCISRHVLWKPAIKIYYYYYYYYIIINSTASSTPCTSAGTVEGLIRCSSALETGYPHTHIVTVLSSFWILREHGDLPLLLTRISFHTSMDM